MLPEFVRSEAERILKKFTCTNCAEHTARVDASASDDERIVCWKCSAEFGFSVGEFRAETHRLGKAQIEHVLKSPKAS